MKTCPLPRSAGLVLPSIAGGVLIWLPVLLAKAAFTSERGRPPIELLTLLMPLVTWWLWRVFVADCRSIAQRTVIPALTFLAMCLAAPLLMFGGSGAVFVWLDPLGLLMQVISVGGYTGTLFGIVGATAVLLVALVRGAAPTPPEPDAPHDLPRQAPRDDAGRELPIGP